MMAVFRWELVFALPPEGGGQAVAQVCLSLWQHSAIAFLIHGLLYVLGKLSEEPQRGLINAKYHSSHLEIVKIERFSKKKKPPTTQNKQTNKNTQTKNKNSFKSTEAGRSVGKA